MSLLQVATDHQARRTELMHRATAKVVNVWRQADVRVLDASWDSLAPHMVALVTAAQVTAARQAAPYMNQVAGLSDGRVEPATLVPEAFGGVMLDGREVGPAMFGAVTSTKELIGRGLPAATAFETGAAYLATIVGAALNDMGRQADSTLATGRGFARYVRVVSPGACSRCAILAGSDRFSKPFLRHPRCKCTMLPLSIGQDTPKGLFSSPDDYFESLSAAEQDRVFTKSGAFAIRHGADPMKVVNARRGALSPGIKPGSPSRLIPKTIGQKPDGSPLQVFSTGEGTTARGSFGRANMGDFTKDGRYRRTTTVRLMPEQIQIMAGDNPARARELLQKYGYIH